MRYKLVIFDLDGTILNTLEDLWNSTNYALATMHFEKRTIDEVRSFVGNGIAKLIERAVPEGTSKEMTVAVLDSFKLYYGEHCLDKTAPYEGIDALIKELRGQGYLTAVVSNKADFAVQELCEKIFPNMFDFVVGEKENIRRKPAPDTVYEVLRILNIDKKDAVYVGDSEVDIETANNSGLDIISVAWGFRDKEFLASKGTKHIVENPKDILKLV